MLSGGATLTRCRQRRCVLAIMPLRLPSKSYGNVSNGATGIGRSVCSFAANRIAI
jgi:hypothetical protein